MIMSSPIRNISKGRKTPLPNFRSGERWRAENTNLTLTPWMVKEYLAQHPKVLEEFAVESASEEQLEWLLVKKRETTVKKKPLKQTWPLYSEIGVAGLSQAIRSSRNDMTLLMQIFGLTEVLSTFFKVDRFTVYSVKENEMHIVNPYNVKEPQRRVGPVGTFMTVSAHVACNGTSENVSNLPQDSRFPKGLGFHNPDAYFVMALPILCLDDVPLAVLEFSRAWEKEEFSIQEFDSANLLMGWVSTCVQNMKENMILEAHSKINTFLLESTKDMFDQIENTDVLVQKVMSFTKGLVGADRCALFLVDEERGELFADYFDQGSNEIGKSHIAKTSQIRFSNKKGIAGYVCRTRECVNIKNAYADPRFNPEVDRRTGYRTNSILCMPVVKRHGVIGVVQLVNKLGGPYFTDKDMKTFEMFSVYCAMALHYSLLYTVMANQKAMYMSAMEDLQYHVKADEDTAITLAKTYKLDAQDVPDDFESFDFCCNYHVDILPELFIHLILDCFGETTFETKKLCSFILTVRKNYRQLPYHNWEHGFHVAHCLWQIIKRHPDIFDKLEKIGLIIAGFCHDLNYKESKDDFFAKLNLPLAALYSTAVLEQQHYKQALTILHADGHEIFSFMNPTQHSKVLTTIQKCISATDLSNYFANQKAMADLIEDDTFDPSDEAHKECMMAIMMTAADLCAVAKPWDTHRKTIYRLFEEFHPQADGKKLGIKRVSQAESTQRDAVPQQQVAFLNYICKPLYSTLYLIMPETKPLLDACNMNNEHWNTFIIEQKTKMSTIKRK